MDLSSGMALPVRAMASPAYDSTAGGGSRAAAGALAGAKRPRCTPAGCHSQYAHLFDVYYSTLTQRHRLWDSAGPVSLLVLWHLDPIEMESKSPCWLGSQA